MPDGWPPPDWAYAAPEGRFDSPFDHPNGIYRVLYASSRRLGCFLETLTRFRVDFDVVAELARIDGYDDYCASGVVPESWLEPRLMGSAHAAGDFADICSTEWTARLRGAMAAECRRHGLREFDVSVTLGPNRRLTQRIFEIAYQASYVGIRYPSRHAHDVENWALFEPFGQISATENARINRNDPDLLKALDLFELQMV